MVNTKKVLLLFSCILLASSSMQAQLPPLGVNSFENWVSAVRLSATPNGLFVKYYIEPVTPVTANQPTRKKILVIKPVNGKWERKYTEATDDIFVGNEYACFQKEDGNKVCLNLRTNKEETDNNKITVNNPSTNQNEVMDDVSALATTVTKDAVVLAGVPDNTGNTPLYWYDLKTKQKTGIWLIPAGKKIRFEESTTSRHLFFTLITPAPSVNESLAEVDIWSYKDPLDPEPFKQRKTEYESAYAISATSGHKVISLTGVNERMLCSYGDLALISYNKANGYYNEMNRSDEAYWNVKVRTSFYLISLLDGARTLVTTQEKVGRNQQFEGILDPTGNFVVIADGLGMSYKAYNIRTGIINDISKGIRITKTYNDTDASFLDTRTVWAPDNTFIVEDNHDLWKLDMTGRHVPVNITGGYGAKNRMIFQLLHVGSANDKLWPEITKTAGMYMLNVLDQKDKSWGFYKMPDLSGKEPVKIYMGPYYFGGDGLRIMRAENAEVFFLEREAVAEAKCFVATKDFKNFTKLSDVSPEKQYNWMTASLVKWTTPAGRPCEGVLYKPQDFDPSKKYPVVLTVYNQYSSQLNAYMEPNEWSERNGYGNFLPSCWLISNGYLVLIPDVNRRTVGKRLQDSRDIVVAGVEHLSTLPYVDIKHVGIQGTSWGGEQTNYIISHTPVFAAAFSGAGFSERMSSSGFSDAVNQGHNMMHNEFVLGGVLTEVPERYIAETALFSSDKVVTPVLFKHNKDDDAVPFYQSLQYFRLLRRLGKKAWLLQYENGGHGIREGKYNEDLMTRVSQFFNHFLKGAPAPVWLTNDITPESKK